MTTLEVIKFRDVLPVSLIPRLVPGTPDLTVELKGEDFRSAEVVSINDLSSPEFVIIDKQTIYAQIPTGIDQIKTVSVISSNFTTTKTASKILYQVGSKTHSISGLLKLVQLFIKVLLQSQGSDIFNPELGGGLQDLVGRITSTKRPDKVLGAISQAIGQTESQIRKAQLDTPGLALTERLLSASILDIHMLESQDEARARVQIDNIVGQTGVAALEL